MIDMPGTERAKELYWSQYARMAMRVDKNNPVGSYPGEAVEK